MSNGKPAPGEAGDQRDREHDLSATEEFAKMREVMRASQRHREGGMDPEPGPAEPDPGPDS